MSERQPRFEIAHGPVRPVEWADPIDDDPPTYRPWHTRYRAANGRIVWTTETYGRRRAAVKAIEILGFALLPHSDGSLKVLDQLGDIIEVREVEA